MTNLIIIDITDKEKMLLDGESNKKEIVGNGTLIVKNPSQKSRLWNLSCNLKEIVNTNIGSVGLNVGALNPGQEFAKEYEIENLKEPCLKVVEIFDTDREIHDIINNTFFYQNDNKCKLKLTLDNPLNLPISNIKLKREIPDIFQDIEVKDPKIGAASLNDENGNKSLTWEIDALGENQSAELEMFCIVNVKERGEQSLGALNVTYLINNYKLTMMDPEIRGLTDSMSGIDRNEGSQPGTWECSVEFINESEFQVRLEGVNVMQKIKTGDETVVDQAPDETLTTKKSWNYNFQVESKNVPELSAKVEFTPLFEIIPKVIGEINKESTIYTVLSATIDKAINPPEVDAYANTNMTIDNSIVNNGSSAIESLTIIDEIPADFVPPLLDQIKLNMGDLNIGARQEFIQKVEIEPDDQNPESKHLIRIELINLSEHLVPNSKFMASYPLLGKNPKPEVEYKTPVTIEINSPIAGKNFVKAPDITPEIKIKYVQRKLKTLKSIKPGITEGEFNITVQIQNKGSVELENILIKDKIPQGFSLTSVSIDKYELVNQGEESELQVKIVELKANDSIILDYCCSGQRDCPRYEPQVIVLGREGSASSISQGGKTGAKLQPVAAVTSVSQQQKAKINDLFSSILKKLDKATTGLDLGNYIEGLKDNFPPGPMLHQFMQFAKEIKAYGKKTIIGSLKDDIVAKLDNFKQNYV